MTDSIKNLNERLKWAVWHGDVAECRQLMKAGAKVPGTMSACEQAEWFASAIKAPDHQMELVDLLLEAGFDPNSVYDRIGEEYEGTPFVDAAAAGRLDLMKRLAAAGADIHWRSPTGANASSEAMPCRSWQASRNDSPERAEVCAWLAQQGVRMDPHCRDSRRKLAWAASRPCSWPDISGLLDLGMDAALLEWTPLMFRIASGEAGVRDVAAMPAWEINHRDCYNRTPFLMAIAAGRQDLAEALLARGCDPDARGWCGDSALHYAAKFDHAGIVEWLVARGTSVEILDDHQSPPLHAAVGAGSLAAARALVNLGANVLASDGIGFPLIHEANSREMLGLLLDAGAEVNAPFGGEWPLKSACQAGDAETVQFLLDRGAHPDLTSTGETALFSAVRSDSLECVRLLLDAGASVNAQDVDGWTCLWCVHSVPMAQLLLERGADPGIGDECGGLPETWSLPLEVTALYRKVRTGAR